MAVDDYQGGLKNTFSFWSLLKSDLFIINIQKCQNWLLAFKSKKKVKKAFWLSKERIHIKCQVNHYEIVATQ